MSDFLAVGSVPTATASVTTRDEFTLWVAPHLKAMASLAGRLAGSSDRDDVVQESLTRAWKRWETYDPSRGTPQTWLLAIVADRARRHAGRWGLPATHLARYPLPDRVEGYEPDVDLATAVGRLPRRQRLAVELHYYLGLSVRETAEVMGCSEGTVKSTLSDARKRLRSLLGEQ